MLQGAPPITRVSMLPMARIRIAQVKGQPPLIRVRRMPPEWLRPHAGPAFFHHQVAPACGETKGAVIQGHAKNGANAKQRHHEGRRFEPDQSAQQDHSHQRSRHDKTVNMPERCLGLHLNTAWVVHRVSDQLKKSSNLPRPFLATWMGRLVS